MSGGALRRSMSPCSSRWSVPWYSVDRGGHRFERGLAAGRGSKGHRGVTSRDKRGMRKCLVSRRSSERRWVRLLRSGLHA